MEEDRRPPAPELHAPVPPPALAPGLPVPGMVPVPKGRCLLRWLLRRCHWGCDFGLHGRTIQRLVIFQLNIRNIAGGILRDYGFLIGINRHGLLLSAVKSSFLSLLYKKRASNANFYYEVFPLFPV